MVRANDENAQPQNLNVRREPTPVDKERTRFGFTRRATSVRSRSLQGCQSSPACQSSTGEPEAEVSTLTPRSTTPGPVVLLPLLESTLGDPDERLPLLRAKPAAGKYDFKGRIVELSEQNKSLRSALAEQRERQRALADALASAQTDINWRLRLAEGEVVEAKHRLDEQLVHTMQEAVRTVWREECMLKDSQAEKEKMEVSDVDQLQALRQCCATEACRAARAEALAAERGEALAVARREAREAREAHEASIAREQAAEQKAMQARQLVREAGALLETQVEESTARYKELLEASNVKERSLSTELAAATAREHDTGVKLDLALCRVRELEVLVED